MPEKNKVSNSIQGTVENNHYPSSVDDMVRNDTPFEGTATSLPAGLNPLPGADGTLPVRQITKIVKTTGA